GGCDDAAPAEPSVADGAVADGTEPDGAVPAPEDDEAPEDGDGGTAWCWARTVVDGTRTASNAANVRWIVAFASLTIMLFVPDICWLASAIISSLKLRPEG